MELFRWDDGQYPQMSYVSATHPGVVRGPHEHMDQADLFCFFSSTFELTLWDNREDSETYQQRETIIGGVDSPKSVLVPPGVVHAYKNVGGELGIVVNLPDRLYKGYGRTGTVDEIRHELNRQSAFSV